MALQISHTKSWGIIKSAVGLAAKELKGKSDVDARKGLFHDWLAQKGKLGGQHKIPRLSNTREYIEEMLELNEE